MDGPDGGRFWRIHSSASNDRTDLPTAQKGASPVSIDALGHDDAVIPAIVGHDSLPRHRHASHVPNAAPQGAPEVRQIQSHVAHSRRASLATRRHPRVLPRRAHRRLPRFGTHSLALLPLQAVYGPKYGRTLSPPICCCCHHGYHLSRLQLARWTDFFSLRLARLIKNRPIGASSSAKWRALTPKPRRSAMYICSNLDRGDIQTTNQCRLRTKQCTEKTSQF